MSVRHDHKMNYYVVEHKGKVMLITHHKLIAQKYLKNLLEELKD